MTGNHDRLVRRLRRRMQTLGRRGRSEPLSVHDVSEARARVRRLQALGDRFRHVDLSPDVASGAAVGGVGRVGGVCVATEV